MSAIVESYNQIAESFCKRTVSSSRCEVRKHFSQNLKKGARILDAGCGSGRDTKGFREEGFVVEPIDGSKEIVKFATQFTGQPVTCLLFEEMEFEECFDGIWSSVSLVHHKPSEIKQVFPRFIRALKPGGYWFISLKYGQGQEHIRNDVHFYLHNEESLKAILSQFQELSLKKMWVKEGTVGEHKKPADWIYCIVRKESLLD
jgi:SAM-dependent methyltransferase